MLEQKILAVRLSGDEMHARIFKATVYEIFGLIASAATACHPPFATRRFPGLTPLLPPVSHTSGPEQHKGRAMQSKSLYIEEDVEDGHSFSAWLLTSCFILNNKTTFPYLV